jgi:hypothetical protein
MAFNAGQGIIKLLLDATGIKNASGIAKSALGGFKAASLAAATGITALTVALKSSVSSFLEAEEASAKLAAVVKATGQASGFTAKQLEAQASSFESMTKFSDETIVNMQAVLATFKNVRGDEFVRAEKAIMDMATVLGTDLKAAAIQVGKALQDPEQGLTALGRAGVTFTDSQKETIKGFISMGDMAKAQQAILTEIESQMGGASTAAANTLGGALAQLANQWDNVKESVGQSVAPALLEVIGLVKQLIPAFGEGLTAAVQAALETFNALLKSTVDFVGGMENAKAIITTVTAVLGNAIKIMQVGFLQVFEIIVRVMDGVISTIVNLIGKLVQVIGLLEELAGLDLGIAKLGDDLANFQLAPNFIEGLKQAKEEIAESINMSVMGTNQPKAVETTNAFTPNASKVNAPRAFDMPKSTGKGASFTSGIDMFKNIQTSIFKLDPAVVEQKQTNNYLLKLIGLQGQAIQVLNSMHNSPRKGIF